MMNSKTKSTPHLLMTGDIHLGRVSSRIPDTVHPDILRASTAWIRIVDLAIRQQVSVVCLSGDIADENNKFWEAIGPLEKGVRQLADAGIRTIAVAGNHDFDVLVRLADQFPEDDFKLLGRGGNWERITIEVDGQPTLHIDGWSFASQHVQTSPLDSYDLSPDPALPILGMVHGDLNAVTSKYAPLDLAQMQAKPPAGWLLGHIHAYSLIEKRPWVLYPGSPQAFDPGETGVHGPWMLQVVDGTLGLPEHYPLSSVWYGSVDVDLSDVEEPTQLEAAILDKVRDEADHVLSQAGPALNYISLRMQLVGATAVSDIVAGVVDQITDELSLPAGIGSVGVEKFKIETLPKIDLEETAKLQSAPGAVAKMLLELEQPDVSDEVKQLIREAREELESLQRHKDFAQLERRSISEDMARDYLRTQGRALLTELVEQK